MNHAPFAIWCVGLTALLVVAATFTDLRWRRIPNFLTFPAFFIAIVLHVAFEGWGSVVATLAGAVMAPTLLLLIHGGKGLGMGDLKLAAAVGACIGPFLAVVSIIVSAVAGGVMAMLAMMRPGGALSQLVDTLTIGLPRRGSRARAGSDGTAVATPVTIPYGVALAVGTIATIAVSWLIGNDTWFLSFVGIAVSQ